MLLLFRSTEKLMSETNQQVQSPLPSKISHGRDELNLAEFPLSAISTRTDPNHQTMVFEDKVWDKSQQEMVTRKLTIAASAEHGLPTALDDEIVLGLIQLSKLQGFLDRKVHFSRYQLIRVLGWRDESKSYARIEEALNRWMGVTLFYDKAWWNKKERCWVNEKFHILDNVSLLDRERRKAKKAQQADLPFSSFTWNDVIFQSFRSGNLKSLDFEFYKSLESAIAKRLYRFLDKRFHFGNRLVFNLKELAWEHIGLSRNYDVANLKRKLLPAIQELEESGFLVSLSPAKRFRKLQVGTWEVEFQKPGKSRTLDSKHEEERADLIQALVSRGVTESVAKELVQSVEAVQIEEKIQVFEWLKSQKDRQVSNSAGFLVASIRENYEVPENYESPEERAKKQAKIEQKKEKNNALKKRKAAQEAARQKKEQEIAASVEAYWLSLTEQQQDEMRTEVSKSSEGLIKEDSPLVDSLVRARIEEILNENGEIK